MDIWPWQQNSLQAVVSHSTLTRLCIRTLPPPALSRIRRSCNTSATAPLMHRLALRDGGRARPAGEGGIAIGQIPPNARGPLCSGRRRRRRRLQEEQAKQYASLTLSPFLFESALLCLPACRTSSVVGFPSSGQPYSLLLLARSLDLDWTCCLPGCSLPGCSSFPATVAPSLCPDQAHPCLFYFANHAIASCSRPQRRQSGIRSPAGRPQRSTRGAGERWALLL